MNFAIKDSIGGWKDNAFMYKSARACTTIKYLTGGDAWIPIIRALENQQYHVLSNTCRTNNMMIIDQK